MPTAPTGADPIKFHKELHDDEDAARRSKAHTSRNDEPRPVEGPTERQTERPVGGQ